VPEDLDLHFVFHCGYSLQDGRRCVNNFCADFRQKKSPGFLSLARTLLGGPSFCKSLSINDLRKVGPHSKSHAKCRLARFLLSI
jgi:hypothetical protein